MPTYSDEDIEKARESALLVSDTLALVAREIGPGISPLHLDGIAEAFIRDHGAEPGFKGYQGFPNSLCTSVNEQIVHGIPTDQGLKEGDIISIDCGVLKNGFYGDHAYTFPIGELQPATDHLLRITKESLYKGIEASHKGNRVGDIGNAVQSHAEAFGYGVVRELVGHGLGVQMHESPEIPNYGKKGKGKKLTDGMIMAIEPMINLGTRKIRVMEDKWTVVTADGKPSAHFEHDIAILSNGATEILSDFHRIEKELGLLEDA
ncbi:MAG: type I methionyl aminopeptidase [Flavobacteriales bacterium]